MSTLILKKSSAEYQRFARFMAVGFSVTALDFGVLTLLKLAGTPTLPANTISFLIGMLNSYIWNCRWTFNDCHSRARGAQMARFILVSLAGLAFSNLIIAALEAPLGAFLGQPEWSYLPAKALATSIVVFWNYFANRYWTFHPATPVQEGY